MAYGSFIVGGGGTIPRIGDIVFTTVKTSPAARYKNTVWELVAQNRVPMGAGDGHEGGETVEAGLPNITGVLDNSVFVSSAGKKALSAINSETGGRYKDGTYTEHYLRKISFDASRSNPIYGASDTVQPSGYYFYFWRRVS
nr:MAG TPA_asm: hypothetical protein [Caudoviricetes sp.]